jgi:O-antigen ligase
MNAIRIGICGAVVFAVLAFGGVEPWGQGALEIGAASLLVLWGVLAVRGEYAEIDWNWLYLPLFGLGAFALVQCTFGLSVYPHLTKLELLRWGAYVLFFFLTVESFRSLEQARWFIWFLVIFGFAVSLFAIVQHFTSNDQTIYWSVPLASGGNVFGPYVNRDDFAGFVEVIAPLGLALLFFRAVHREHTALLLLFTIVPIGALMLSASRGGIIGLFFEIALLVFLSRANEIGRKQLLAITGLVLVAGTFIVWLGVSEAIQKFELLSSSEMSTDTRVAMYHDTWHIFADHPWAGTGLGTLQATFPRYASFYNGFAVDHAHNDYLELLADTGIVGGLCGLSFIGLLFWKGLANLRSSQRRATKAVYAGSLAACTGLLLHSLVDFNLHIPANALIFMTLAAIATSEITESSTKHFLEPSHLLAPGEADQGLKVHG